MTSEKRPRLLFDENFGKPGIEALAIFLSSTPNGPALEVRHLLEFFPSGTDDEVWIPQVSKEDFILITSDRHKRRGRKASRGKPLPRLCVQYGIRHVLLSGSLAQHKMSDKVLAVLSVLNEILAIANQPRGTRYGLETAGLGKGRLKLKPTASPIAGPKSQKQFPFPGPTQVQETTVSR